MMINPVVKPIHLSSTFQRNADGSYDGGFIYSSINNPNRQDLEESLAQLESGAIGFAFASGMAAIHAVLQSLQAGDHILVPDDAFYQVRRLVSDVYARWGLSFTIVDMSKIDAVQQAMKKNTKLIWVETPSNPLLEITDISAIAEIAKSKDCFVVVDNTWATPILQNPLTLGADIVMHSTTKYFGGHHDVVGGGLVIGEEGELANRIRDIQKLCGGVPSPQDCWMISRGIKTLRIRVIQQAGSAHRLALFLQEHNAIQDVYYPGLPSHPQHKIATQQMQNGFGGMLSVLIKGDELRALEITNKLRLFTSATSLGGVDSLVEHRRSVEGPESKAPKNLLRLSVGIEPIADMLQDWSQALG